MLRAAQPAEIVAGAAGAKVMLLGGAPMDGPRHIWWNFVSSSKERIEQAKADWREGPLRQGAGRPGVHPAAGEVTNLLPTQGYERQVGQM